MILLERTLAEITPQNQEFRKQATARIEQLTMPHWALGSLCDLAVDLAGITESLTPNVARKTVITMAGDHGVVAEGVSAFPQEVTVQMVANFVNGGAGVNVLARLEGVEVLVVDMGVAGDLSALATTGKILDRKIAPGTGNIAAGPAMTREQAIASIEAGINIANEVSSTSDILGTGDMGIGNTTPSTAIVATLTGQSVAELTGRGTGIDDAALDHKIAVIEKALAVNQPQPDDALDVLAKVGGFEIGGIAGLILGAAANRKPVVIDGFISTAGALIAHALCPACSEYMIAAHRSAEPGHTAMQQQLGKTPLLDLNLRLGEGTGAVLAMNLIEAAKRILTEMSTFAEAHVAEKK